MALKFAGLIKSFLPKGKAWELKDNSSKLIDGMGGEFERSYNTATAFYNDFNIIQSENLADRHGQDCLIKTELFTKRELQRIIVEYLNKDYDYKSIIIDFGSFINETVSFITLPTAMEFGELQFGDELGDPTLSRNMELLIKFSDTISCANYKKLEWLALYLKPPYVNVIFENKPINSITPFTFGYSQFGDELGELSAC